MALVDNAQTCINWFIKAGWNINAIKAVMANIMAESTCSTGALNYATPTRNPAVGLVQWYNNSWADQAMQHRSASVDDYNFQCQLIDTSANQGQWIETTSWPFSWVNFVNNQSNYSAADLTSAFSMNFERYGGDGSERVKFISQLDNLGVNWGSNTGTGNVVENGDNTGTKPDASNDNNNDNYFPCGNHDTGVDLDGINNDKNNSGGSQSSNSGQGSSNLSDANYTNLYTDAMKYVNNMNYKNDGTWTWDKSKGTMTTDNSGFLGAVLKDCNFPVSNTKPTITTLNDLLLSYNFKKVYDGICTVNASEHTLNFSLKDNDIVFFCTSNLFPNTASTMTAIAGPQVLDANNYVTNSQAVVCYPSTSGDSDLVVTDIVPFVPKMQQGAINLYMRVYRVVADVHRKFSLLITSQASGTFNEESRGNTAIDMIIIHHNATTNYQVAIDTWLVSAGNNTSAHYEITDNQIIGVVPEYNIAYHAGNWNVNTRSIGLEHVNATVGPPDAMYTVSQTTLKNSAKLCADICRNYNIPIDRDHIKGHNEVSDTGTFCPGTINMDNYVQLVKNY